MANCAINILTDIAIDNLSGRKPDIAEAALGCIPGFGQVKNAIKAAKILKTAKGATRSLNDISSIRGASKMEVAVLIPEGWIAKPTRKSGGTRYANPEKRGSKFV